MVTGCIQHLSCLSGWYFLNCETICNQIWYGDTPINVCLDSICWTTEPFVTKCGMVIQHKLGYHVDKINWSAVLKWSQGSLNQDCFWTSDPFTTGLWWCIIRSWIVLWKKGCTSGSLVEFVYFVFTCMTGESYCRGLRSLLLYLCYVFWVLMNSLVCRFCLVKRLSCLRSRSQ